MCVSLFLPSETDILFAPIVSSLPVFSNVAFALDLRRFAPVVDGVTEERGGLGGRAGAGGMRDGDAGEIGGGVAAAASRGIIVAGAIAGGGGAGGVGEASGVAEVRVGRGWRRRDSPAAVE